MGSFNELYFNVDNGYLEGLVRGFKAGILSQGDYLNLVQCETLEGETRGSEPHCPLLQLAQQLHVGLLQVMGFSYVYLLCFDT
uniref:Uncharacterized protein n=1 Tax=Callorhinchus milii TaxID=7868 RepID=A0A4W3JWG7_CALMI